MFFSRSNREQDQPAPPGNTDPAPPPVDQAQPQTPASPSTPEPTTVNEFLDDAIARNAPIELFASERVGRMPAARGRLIAVEDNRLLIDEVQTIGRDVRLAPKQTYEAYFTRNDAIFHFRTTVIEAICNVRLNDRKVVPGAALSPPRRVDAGQRRNAYRVSMATQPTKPIAQLIPAPLGLASEPIPPTDPPLFTAEVVDASETGLGLVIPNLTTSKFKRFRTFFVRLNIPSDEEPTFLVAELRQFRPIRDDTAIKLGLLVLPWPSHGELRRNIKPLADLIREIQRIELMRRAV